MDHHSLFYRGREGGGGGALPQFAAMDSLDLNLHLAPPLANPAATPPYPHPLRHQHSRSEVANRGMFHHFQPLPTPPPMWTRFFLDTDPPSPGEIDFAAYHPFHDYQQSPFWGMDLTDVDAGQDLDLDFNFLRDDEDELEAPLVNRDDDYNQPGDDGDEQDWWDWRGSAAIAPHSSRATTAEAPQSSSASPAKSQASRKKPAANCAASASSPDSQLEDHLQAKQQCDDHRDQQSQQQSSGKDIFFDCNVCFDVASEPVVTSCGHLFCWPCLYQWLHVHSNHEECPVCKGAVSDGDVIPIYGRGGGGSRSCSSSSNVLGDIPPRPRARRTDLVRQAQPPADVVLGEMLRWRRLMRMWHQHTSRLMLERRGGIDGGRVALAPGLHGMIDNLHHQWPYHSVGTDADARM